MERKQRLAFRDTEPPVLRLDGEEADLQKKQRKMPWDMSDAELEKLKTEEGTAAESGWARFQKVVLTKLGGAVTALILLLAFAGILWALVSHKQRVAAAEADKPATLRVDQIDEALVAEFFEEYFAAPTWKERLRLVRNPDAAAPKMEAFYARNPLEKGPLGPIKSFGVVVNRFVEFPYAVATQGEDGAPLKASFELTEEGMRVDWESLVGYSEITLPELLQERPSEPRLARVELVAADYYNYTYSDDKEWAGFMLGVRHTSFSCYGYLKRDSQAFRRLDQYIQSERATGWTKSFFPVLKLRVDPECESDDQVEIVDVLSFHWLIP